MVTRAHAVPKANHTAGRQGVKGGLTTNMRLRATERELRRFVAVIIQPEKEWRLMLDDTKKWDSAR